MKKFLFLLLFLTLNFVLAQESGFDLIQTRVIRIIGNIIRFLFSFLMILASILLIFLGVKYILAKGEVKELHQSLLFLILGIVLLIISMFVPNLIKNLIENLIK